MPKNRRKGMTLVELLIVMIIIGILASMLMLSGLEATGRAHATNIVSNMESLREACLIYFCDNEDWPSDLSTLEDCMNIQFSKEEWNQRGYSIHRSSSTDLSCILYDISKSDNSTRNCLEKMALDSSLLYSPNSTDLDSTEGLAEYGNASASDAGFILKVFRKSSPKSK